MSFSIPTKTCDYPQISVLHENRGYRSSGPSYKSNYPYAIKTEYQEYSWCFISKDPQNPHFGFKLSGSFLF